MEKRTLTLGVRLGKLRCTSRIWGARGGASLFYLHSRALTKPDAQIGLVCFCHMQIQAERIEAFDRLYIHLLYDFVRLMAWNVDQT